MLLFAVNKLHLILLANSSGGGCAGHEPGERRAPGAGLRDTG
jgi:hypothetical protein